MSAVRRQETNDPVVVYDVMREAAHRLIAGYASWRGPFGLPEAAAAEIRRVRSRVDSVDITDLDEQRRLTAEFRRCATRLARP